MRPIRSATLVLIATLPMTALAQDTSKSLSNEPTALAEMKQMFGMVPSFIKQLPQEAIDGAWADMKGLMSPTGAIPAKYRDLISLAVSSQVPCQYCIYFDTQMSRVDGANDRERGEAILMAAITRKASTILNGSLQDDAEFRREADKMFSFAKAQTGKPPVAQTEPKDAATAYKNMEQLFGSVPTFMRRYPPAAVAGFWKEFKSVQLNPETAVPNKYKELIGLAVAAQIPCKYCLYFHRESARMNGATQAELDEAIAIAGDTRHWSTILYGLQVDDKVFRKEVDTMVKFMRKNMGETEMAPTAPTAPTGKMKNP